MNDVPLLKLIFPGGRHRIVPVRADPFTIGRRQDNHLVLNNEDISRVQAIIHLRDGAYVLEDQESLFGTSVNGETISSRPLTNRDVISFGREKSIEILFLHGDRMHSILDQVSRTPDRETSREELRNLNILLEISKGLNSFSSLTDLLELSLDAVIDLTRAERGFVMLREAGDELVMHAARNMAGERIRPENLRISMSVVSEVMQTGAPVFHEDVLEESDMRDRSSIAELRLRAIACLPMKMPAAHAATRFDARPRPESTAGERAGILGVIYTDSSEATRPASDITRELVESVASHAALAVENFRLRQEDLERRVIEAEMVKLREVDRLKSDFVSHVSHELRTPLTAIKGALDNMLDGLTGNLNEKQARYLVRMKDNTSHLVRLIEDLLDLSRIEAGQIGLNPRPLDLGRLVAEACDALRPIAVERKIDLVALTSAELTIRADRDRVMQILMNLAGNALKFTGEGGRVEVQTENAGAHARIRVSDTGEGIDADSTVRIFERFYRAPSDRTGKVEGTGLGLSIAKSLVELHGGSISVESEVGTGTTFTVTLPVSGPPPQPAPPQRGEAARERGATARPHDRSLEG